MKFTILILLSVVAMISCKRGELIPNLVIGMEESAWNDTVKSMIKRGELHIMDTRDSLSFEFKCNTGDTLLSSIIEVNNDGVSKGKLRVISYDFTSGNGILKPNPTSMDPLYPNLEEETEFLNTLDFEQSIGYMKNEDGRINNIFSKVIPFGAYNYLFSFLARKFGSPDSILDKNSHRIDTMDYKNHKVIGAPDYSPRKGFDLDLIGKDNADWQRISLIVARTIDTSSFSYYFHDSKSVILLERDRFEKPNYFIPFLHTFKTKLYQYSKSYKKEFQESQTAILRNMRPNELITIPLFYDIEKKSSDYGLVLTYLMVRAILDPTLRKLAAETRPIESMKGKIIINDKYGTLLQEVPDIEIQAHGSLPARIIPGLDYAFGLTGGVSFNPYSFTLGIYVGHKSISPALKQAVEIKSILAIEFITDAILFTDGTVLK